VTHVEPFEPLPGEQIVALDVFDDGRRVALGTYRRAEDGPGRTLIWDQEKDQAYPVESLRSLWDLALDPKGGLLATAGRNEREVMMRLWRLDDPPVCVLEDDAYTAGYHVEFSADGTLLALGSQDPVVKVWRLRRDGSAGHPMEFDTHGSRAIVSLAFSPDGRILAAGAVGGQVYLWDLKSRTLLWSFKVHDGDVNDLAFTPDSEVLVSAGDDHRVVQWDLGLPARLRQRNLDVDRGLGTPAADQAMAELFFAQGMWKDVLSSLRAARSGVLTLDPERLFLACWSVGEFACAREQLDALEPGPTLEIWRAALARK
jgi:WD40 repeat protein